MPPEKKLNRQDLRVWCIEQLEAQKPDTILPSNKSYVILMSHRFTTKLDEDDYGDLILTIPYEICEELGWNIQTELQFELGDEGSSIILKKAID